MKLVVIGGGSSYTPELMEGVILHQGTLPVTEVVLVDIEAGKEKLQINTEFAKRMVKKAGTAISVTGTLNRRCFEVDVTKHQDKITALISIDLNDLKKINDMQVK